MASVEEIKQEVVLLNRLYCALVEARQWGSAGQCIERLAEIMGCTDGEPAA